ncbi:DUF4007 family protein [Streptomyces sp. NBC_01221]|uniref:DUF4007 family protein n=1 Tax=Streptomyces sp. NBC_01221 TaxID=2903782 RepID=UPI0022533CB2|nr:DUF4007 family protein [Streptomyces sp. NBC_01221]MCX4791994.1 DUF4007 family protein [Streptomyces sp. NBC_01221]
MSFWSQVFGLSRREGRTLVPTARAHWLLDDDRGTDTFLESDISLWLLHWWLLSASPCHVPSWRYLFGYAPVSRYSRTELQGRLADTAGAAGWKTPASSVLGADIACLVRMYAPGDHTAATIEDALSNPFRTLHLLDPEPPPGSPGDRSHLVTVHRTAGRRCPGSIQAYASLDFAARTLGHTSGSISLSRLGSDPLGPGRLLLTGTAELRHTLHRTAAQHPDLAVVQSADGEELLAFSSRPDHLAERILAAAGPAVSGG